MFQLILMGIGVANLFRLARINTIGARLGLDAETLAKWQICRRRQYMWMIAAGWGTFIAEVILGAVISNAGNLTENGAIGAQIVLFIVGVVAMFVCYSKSSAESETAKKLEAQKA